MMMRVVAWAAVAWTACGSPRATPRALATSALGLAPARGGPARPWAVVTGASSGIGAALARRASLEGYSVVLHGRDRGALERVARSLADDCEARVVVGDLARRRGAERLHRACRSLDVRLLLNNAGAARVAPFVDDDLAGLDALLALNVRATVALCRLFGADFAGKGRGRVVITGSLVGVPAHGCAGTACYASTKAFLRSFGNALHDELRPRGVDVTVLLPGAVDSAFAATAGMEAALIFAVPGGRALGVVHRPDDVANAAFASGSARAREVVPGLANKAYAAATEVLPSAPVRCRTGSHAPRTPRRSPEVEARTRGHTQLHPSNGDRSAPSHPHSTPENADAGAVSRLP